MNSNIPVPCFQSNSTVIIHKIHDVTVCIVDVCAACIRKREKYCQCDEMSCCYISKFILICAHEHHWPKNERRKEKKLKKNCKKWICWRIVCNKFLTHLICTNTNAHFVFLFFLLLLLFSSLFSFTRRKIINKLVWDQWSYLISTDVYFSWISQTLF